MDVTHATHASPEKRINRYVDEAEPEVYPPTGGWIAAAVDATTIGELYELATAAQASGEWDARDADWCRALRDALGVGDRAAMALLRREFPGARR